VFDASYTDISGKTLPAPFYCGPLTILPRMFLQVTFLFWPIASCYRCLTSLGVLKFRVRNVPLTSFADQSADGVSANVRQVTFRFWPIARSYRSLMQRTPKYRVRCFLRPLFGDCRPLTMLPRMFRIIRRWHFCSGQLQVAVEVQCRSH